MLILGDWLLRVPVHGNKLDADRVILLSGFMFPFDGMPQVAQRIAEVLPMTHFMRLIRGVILRGADLWELRHSSARRTKRSGSGVSQR